MNTQLWQAVLAFDFDTPISEYGFSTRLAKENYWTKDFTNRAIVEYKKFMYLAAVSDFMVSPSGVVDAVWHQHLVFTKSYNDFCELLGKRIQHVPSTHNKVDFGKFKQAKERTRSLYQSTFGEMPKEVWEYAGMYESLELPKAKWKIRTFLIVGILAFIALTVPFYFLLRPLYIQIDSSDFIPYYLVIACIGIAGLELYNRAYLKRVVAAFKKNTFIYRLNPSELVYLKTRSIESVVHGVVNKLINDKKIVIEGDNRLEAVSGGTASSVEEHQTLETLNSIGKTNYGYLLGEVNSKACFFDSANCMDAFRKYFIKSRSFGNLFYLNYGILALILMLGFIRLTVGLMREKPTILIAMIIIVFAVAMIVYLLRLTNMMSTSAIPDLYRKQVIRALKQTDQWEWKYFLFGTTVLAPTFIPIVEKRNPSDSSGGGCGTSGGSSCGSSDGDSGGSSCGSSCGGCGGD